MADRWNSQQDHALIAIYLAWFLTLRRGDDVAAQECRDTLGQFESFLSGVGLLHATLPLMEMFINRRRDQHGQASESKGVTEDVSVLRDFYRWCHEQAWTGHDLARALGRPKPTTLESDPSTVADDT